MSPAAEYGPSEFQRTKLEAILVSGATALLSQCGRDSYDSLPVETLSVWKPFDELAGRIPCVVAIGAGHASRDALAQLGQTRQPLAIPSHTKVTLNPSKVGVKNTQEAPRITHITLMGLVWPRQGKPGP